MLFYDNVQFRIILGIDQQISANIIWVSACILSNSIQMESDDNDDTILQWALQVISIYVAALEFNNTKPNINSTWIVLLIHGFFRRKIWLLMCLTQLSMQWSLLKVVAGINFRWNWALCTNNFHRAPFVFEFALAFITPKPYFKH